MLVLPRVVFACLAISAAISLTSGTAHASLLITNQPGDLGVSTLVTFDAPATDTIAELAGIGIGVDSLDITAQPFLSNVGGVGIGSLTSNALGNSRNGQFSNLSDAPFYDLATVRSFEIVFANPLQSFGLDVVGWGGLVVDHSIQVFDESNQLLNAYTFSQLGLLANDSGSNGFFGVVGIGSAIGRVVFTPNFPDATSKDFLGFDNLLVGPVAAVPTPGAIWLFGSGLALLGLKRRQPRM